MILSVLDAKLDRLYRQELTFTKDTVETRLEGAVTTSQLTC